MEVVKNSNVIKIQHRCDLNSILNSRIKTRGPEVITRKSLIAVITAVYRLEIVIKSNYADKLIRISGTSTRQFARIVRHLIAEWKTLLKYALRNVASRRVAKVTAKNAPLSRHTQNRLISSDDAASNSRPRVFDFYRSLRHSCGDGARLLFLASRRRWPRRRRSHVSLEVSFLFSPAESEAQAACATRANFLRYPRARYIS